MKITIKNEKNDFEHYELNPIGSYDRDTWSSIYTSWINDEEVTKFLYQGTIPTSVEKCKNLYDTLTNENNVIFNIHTNWGLDVIGIVGIFDIYWPSRVGEFRILIGDKEYWNRGLGKLCLEEMSHIAFERLNLHKFWLGFNGNHKRAEGAYSKSGFQHECVIKSHHYKNGAYNDLVRMCMFREDYETWKRSKQD